jgi:hypothetical protein
MPPCHKTFLHSRFEQVQARDMTKPAKSQKSPTMADAMRLMALDFMV